VPRRVGAQLARGAVKSAVASEPLVEKARRGHGPLRLAALIACAACTKASPVVIDEPVWVSAPGAEDGAGTCADVHGARACWGGAVRVARVARVVPSALDAWRCIGQGGARACRRRGGSAGPFVCKDGHCDEEHLRMPDDGEWECFERAGVVVCRGAGPAAGVIAGRRDEGWICGDRRDAGAAARICVDLAPDRPDDPSFDACMIQQKSGVVRRVCTQNAEPAVGRACSGDDTCPRGATCERGACLPARAPQGECWLDTDCGAGEACAFATCVKGP
jgi:hypothetical protein